MEHNYHTSWCRGKSHRDVTRVLGPPAAAMGLGKGLHDTSVTEVGMTSDASQPRPPAEHQGAGPWSEEKGLCAASHRSEGVLKAKCDYR